MEEACGNVCRKEAHKKPGELTSAKSHEMIYLKDRMEEACGYIWRKEAHTRK